MRLIALPICAFALVLGANLGSAARLVMATLRGRAGSAARAPGQPDLPPASASSSPLPLLPDRARRWRGSRPKRLRGRSLNFHTGFNLAHGHRLPAADRTGGQALPARSLPDRPQTESIGPAALSGPRAPWNRRRSPSPMPRARRCAWATSSRRMLTQTLDVFRHDDRKLLQEVEELDNERRRAARSDQALPHRGEPRHAGQRGRPARRSTSSPSPPTSSMSATSSTRT